MKKICSILLFITTIFICCKVSYATTVNELIAVSGHKASDSIAIDDFAMINEEEFEKNIMSDLIDELRPFLKNIVGKEKNIYELPSEEIFNKVVKHPVKFLNALYNWIVYSVKEIFDIASENSTIDVKVDK